METFWNMTIGEIFRYLTAMVKHNVRQNYNLSSLIASFTTRIFNGKELPTIDRLYPSLFADDMAESNNELAKASLLAWAAKHNAIRSLKQ